MIDLIRSTGSYLLMCYSGDVDVYLRGGLDKSWVDGGKKIRQKEEKRCCGDFQSVKPDFPRAS